MKVLQLSHTSKKSGGYRHEKLLAESISKKLNAEFKELHFPGTFQSLNAQLKLAFSGFTKTKANANIIAARFAIGAVFKSLLSKKHVLLVMHNWDEFDNKSWALKQYHNILWFLIRLLAPKHFSLVCISRYWKGIFEELLNKRIPIYIYPNLLDSSSYKSYQFSNNKKQIYLGQVSDKNDYSALEIIDRHFTEKGYYCFYSTIVDRATVPYARHNLLKVSESEYLKELSTSVCSISFPKVEEGWSRIAHESFLVGTPVIALKKGGLQHLVSLAGGYLVDTAEEAIGIIEAGPELNDSKVAQLVIEYDISRSDHFIEPIIDFLKQTPD